MADVTSLSGDERLLFNTLEGLVNRTTPRIYLLWGADEGKRTWLETLRRRLHIGVTDVPDAWQMLRTYRASVAGVLGCRQGDVVFTSGGTEADNLAVKGIALARQAANPSLNRVVISAVGTSML